MVILTWPFKAARCCSLTHLFFLQYRSDKSPEHDTDLAVAFWIEEAAKYSPTYKDTLVHISKRQQADGKFITVRVSVPRLVIVLSGRELYINFKAANPTLKMGLKLFSLQRPFNVRTIKV